MIDFTATAEIKYKAVYGEIMFQLSFCFTFHNTDGSSLGCSFVLSDVEKYGYTIVDNNR